MIAKKIFKFPDGNGGFTLQIRDAQGNWHPCDEDGNYLEEPEKGQEDHEENRERPKARSSSGSRKKKTYMKISVVVDSETCRIISDYAAFKSASEHKYISRSQVMLKAALGVIKRDSEFARFNEGSDEDK